MSGWWCTGDLFIVIDRVHIATLPAWLGNWLLASGALNGIFVFYNYRYIVRLVTGTKCLTTGPGRSVGPRMSHVGRGQIYSRKSYTHHTSGCMCCACGFVFHPSCLRQPGSCNANYLEYARNRNKNASRWGWHFV